MRPVLCFLSLVYCLLYVLPARAQGGEGVYIHHNKSESFQQQLTDALQLKSTQPDSARKRLLQLLQEHWRNPDKEALRNILVELSHFTADVKHQQQTLHFAKRAILLCDTQRHQDNLSILYKNMGSIYAQQARYPESMEARTKAIWYARNNPLAVARIEHDMANIVVTMGNIPRALNYYKRSLQTAVAYGDSQLWACALLNIGQLIEGKNDFTYSDSGLQVAQKFKLYDILYTGIINKSSALAINGRPKEALLLLTAADTLNQYTGIAAGLGLKVREIRGTAYTALGQYKRAEELLLSSLDSGNVLHLMSSLKQLRNLYVQQGDFKKALHTADQLQGLLDSVGGQDARLRTIASELIYSNARQSKELAQNKLAMFKKEMTIKTRNIWIGIITAAACVLFTIIILLHRAYRQRQKIQIAEQMNLQLMARIAGEEQERKRISQELHDGIGGILSAAKMSLSAVDSVSQEQMVKYEQGIGLLDEAFDELRQTAHNLSPHILQHKGLIPTLTDYCAKTAEAQNIDIRLQTLGQLSELDQEKALTTYRIIQELIQNVVKHSGASTAMVQLSYKGGHLDITVDDNGRGLLQHAGEEGIGLDNIRNRVTALAGHMDIDSQPGEGTTVYINI